MKPCVHCGTTGRLHVDRAQVPHYEYANAIKPFTLTAHYGETGQTGLFGSSVKARVGIELRAEVCRGCGHVAWFVRDVDQLEGFARAGHGGVRIAE